MPTITTQNTGFDFGNALSLVSGLDQGVITASSATEIVVTWNLGILGTITWTLSGTVFTTRIINGVTYINGGTVDSLSIDEGAGVTYDFTGLALSGRTLGAAWRSDAEGINQAALEALFRNLDYTFLSGNGRTNPSDHQTDTSIEGVSILPTGDNTYLLGTGNDGVLAAGAGNDTIFGNSGNDTLNGNGGNDVIHGEVGSEDIYGGLGNDTLFGVGIASEDPLNTDRDRLYGGDGNDVITMVSGPTLFYYAFGELYGGAGNDVISSNSLAVVSIEGGDGSDTISVSAGRAAGGAGNDVITALVSFQNLGPELLGEGGNDILSGVSSDDILRGGAGSDTLSGQDGYDSLFGGAGNDQLFGGDGRDALFGGTGNDHLFGGEFHDTLFGEEGNDTLAAGEGFFLDTDVLYGGEGNDSLIGGAHAETLDGGEGRDTLTGSANVNPLTGDVINGGEGIDLVTFAASGAGVALSLALGTGQAGDAQGDTYSGIENVLGSAHADAITGDAMGNLLNGGTGNDTLDGLGNNDTLSGGSGDDSLSGGTGDDSLVGGANNDVLSGGSGNDTLVGGAAVDTMTGNSGSDLFLFLTVTETGNTTPDVITDFVTGVDVVSLAGLGLTFVTGAFTAANQIRWDEATSRLQIELNGNGVTDRQIELTGVGADFVRATDLLL